jgi:hypothetical protein
MRNVALAAVIGLLFAAGSLVAAPVARADCNPFEGCWGAIAASPSNGETEFDDRRRESTTCG